MSICEAIKLCKYSTSTKKPDEPFLSASRHVTEHTRCSHGETAGCDVSAQQTRIGLRLKLTSGGNGSLFGFANVRVTTHYSRGPESEHLFVFL